VISIPVAEVFTEVVVLVDEPEPSPETSSQIKPTLAPPELEEDDIEPLEVLLLQ
jgi:hypothetical protein